MYRASLGCHELVMPGRMAGMAKRCSSSDLQGIEAQRSEFQDSQITNRPTDRTLWGPADNNIHRWGDWLSGVAK